MKTIWALILGMFVTLSLAPLLSGAPQLERQRGRGVLDEDWRAKAIWGGGKMILH